MRLALIAGLIMQTLVNPNQIRDANQIQLDSQLGTRISPAQLRDGRHVLPLSGVPWMRPRWPGSPDTTRVVCFRAFARVRTENSGVDLCFGAVDQQTWLSDPANAVWFGGQR